MQTNRMTDKRPAATTQTGLILVDQALTMMALDRGAAAILNYRLERGIKPEPVYVLPEQILEAVRSHNFSDLACLKISLRIGISDYQCRGYLVQCREGFLPRPTVAFLVENRSSAIDAIDKVAIQYHLTRREQEALRGISMGLSSRDVAERMKISPSTLRTFLRLMKIKMGTTSRVGMVTKILQNRLEDATPSCPIA